MKLKSYLKISTAALVIASASVGIGITPAFAQQTAEDQDVMYSSKRMTESYSRKTRSRNVRNQPVDSTIDTDEHTN